MKLKTDVYDELADWLVTTFRALPGIKKPEFMDLIEFLLKRKNTSTCRRSREFCGGPSSPTKLEKNLIREFEVLNACLMLCQESVMVQQKEPCNEKRLS